MLDAARGRSVPTGLSGGASLGRSLTPGRSVPRYLISPVAWGRDEDYLRFFFQLTTEGRG